MVLADSYPEGNYDADNTINNLHPSSTFDHSAAGQCFTSPSTQKIVSAKFYLKKVGSPTGNGHAVLYAITGTYGTNGLPTGEPLGTSDNFDVSTLTTGMQLITFTFTGAEQYEMQNGVYYCIVFEAPEAGTIDGDNYIILAKDGSSPTHDGNYCRYANSGWGGYSSDDVIFYVYNDEPAPPAPAYPLIGKPLITRDIIGKTLIR